MTIDDDTPGAPITATSTGSESRAARNTAIAIIAIAVSRQEGGHDPHHRAACHLSEGSMLVAQTDPIDQIGADGDRYRNGQGTPWNVLVKEQARQQNASSHIAAYPDGQMPEEGEARVDNTRDPGRGWRS